MKNKQLIKLFAAISLGVSFGAFAPDWAIEGVNQVRCAFGGFIRYLVPFIIIGFVTSSIAKAGKSAAKMLLMTMGVALASTVAVGFFAYGVAWGAMPHLVKVVEDVAMSSTTRGSVWDTVPTICALLASIVIGLVVAKSNARHEAGLIERFKGVVSKIIGWTIAPLMPVYIFTVIANMTAKGEIVKLGGDCFKIMGVAVLTTIAVMVMMYMVAGLLAGRNPLKALGNMMPAYVAGCGSCSSVASIPYTMRQVRENGVSDTTAELVIPLCSSVHHLGSVANLIVYAVGVMILTGGTISAHAFIPFILLVTVISFATPGIPGGVAVASASVAGALLGFTEGQYALILAIYIALDGIGTACNLTCDGAVAMIVERLMRVQGVVAPRPLYAHTEEMRNCIALQKAA